MIDLNWVKENVKTYPYGEKVCKGPDEHYWAYDLETDTQFCEMCGYHPAAIMEKVREETPLREGTKKELSKEAFQDIVGYKSYPLEDMVLDFWQEIAKNKKTYYDLEKFDDFRQRNEGYFYEEEDLTEEEETEAWEEARQTIEMQEGLEKEAFQDDAWCFDCGWDGAFWELTEDLKCPKCNSDDIGTPYEIEDVERIAQMVKKAVRDNNALKNFRNKLKIAPSKSGYHVPIDTKQCAQVGSDYLWYIKTNELNSFMDQYGDNIEDYETYDKLLNIIKVDLEELYSEIDPKEHEELYEWATENIMSDMKFEVEQYSDEMIDLDMKMHREIMDELGE